MKRKGQKKNSKKFASENWSYKKIARYAKGAEKYLKGSKSKKNKELYDKLNLYNKRMVRLSNNQLRDLKKAKKDYYAYDSAVTWTNRMYGTTRFKDKGLSPNDTKLQLLAMQRFLRFQTSTVEGHLMVEERRRTKFREKFPELSNVSDDDLNGFLKLLGNAPIRTTLFQIGKLESGGVVDMIKGKWLSEDAEGRKEIAEMFKRFQQTNAKMVGEPWYEYDLGYDELIKYLKERNRK